MRLLIAALVTLSAAPLFGDTIVATPLPPATMLELARGSAVPMPALQRRDRESRDRERPARPATAAMENPVVATMAVTPLAAPPATRGFQAMNQSYGATTEPADAGGAVGPKHVVGAFNNGITVHDRAGKLLSRVDDYNFWRDPSYLPDKITYDPRVAYDAANDRWVIVALGDDASYTKGVLFVAISVSGDPTAGWRRFRLRADPTGLLDVDVSHLAITADRIVITTNVWSTLADGGTRVNTTVFLAVKNAAFAGPSLSMTTIVLPPKEDLLPLSSDDATIRLVEWLGNARIQTSVLLEYGPVVDSHLWSASYSSAPTCEQRDSNAIAQCCGVALSGIARNGTMWIADDECGTSLVWKIKDGTATTYSLQVDGRGIGFPSIAVNRNGAALVGYVLMSSFMYLTAGYSYIDPSGNISAPTVLKDGEGPYTGQRWGDFTTTVVDPVDDLSFWTVGNYAEATTLPRARWATWWGYIRIGDGPAKRHAVH
jgi:hypothetical protein